MRAVLERDPFRVKPSQITVLTDWQIDKSLQPTRANIEREFNRLAGLVRKDDQVFILMGGHGSQQPADDDPNDFEPDGLDELFLPADVQGWDGKKGRVVNAITDDEIRVWLDRIRKPGAFVWIAFDSCHSGTMIRGASSSVERARMVPMEELVPADARPKARLTEGASRTPPAPSREQYELGTDSGDVVALYAAQPDETTPETGNPAYGLFTFTMTEVLQQARSPLTYRELAERVSDRYRALNRTAPTPMVEGTGVDREVLGQKSWPERPQWTLVHDSKNSMIVNAGRLQGLTRGSILDVFPPAGSAGADTPVGQVTVVDLRPLESAVEPIAVGASVAAGRERLVPGSRCRLAQADFGEMTLRVGLQRQGAGSRADDVETLRLADAPPVVGTAMKRLRELTHGLARGVDQAADADWFVRLIADGRVVLVPASGLPAPTDGASQVQSASFEVGAHLDDAFETQLVANVTRLSRARNLLALAGAPANDSPVSPGSIAVKVEVLRYPAESSTGATPVEFGPEGRVLRVGDRVAFRLTNTGDVDTDVTLLFVDAEFSIVSLFPTRGAANNRLARGKTYTTPIYPVSGPTGAEQVVAIAVPAASPPASFAAFEQDPLTRSRRVESGKPSPLGQLLKRAMDGEGSTRSLGAPELATYRMMLLSWTTEPAK